ncbi:formate dehydrogenase accessory sulfurtransferase FdhD [Aromatoleum anaerobium]|uniref:Sulfur carrier protein FdhD n=3 Tax=Aromatoleum TaxID=551759 RepID=A0ABX1PP90_9RHOO|nr:formate dehydrogenase accessory sulfurtransferase FdhD [Aromatoleum anaerobium]MCK0506424.1 formate dehydrogenase accessory sulfurtransferase FdhD [Aromatoleum anaerobium]
MVFLRPNAHWPAHETPHGNYRVERRVDGVTISTHDCIAEETPVALVYNGVAHTVMMATPLDIEDFAAGFSLSEGIVARAREVYDLEVIARDNGMEARLEIATERALLLRAQHRAMAGRTGCGLCGVESLERFRAPVPAVRSTVGLAAGALSVAHSQLVGMQPLFHLTGAVHAAAWCGLDGAVALVREDVGRHNALDKLIGAVATNGSAFGDGFVLMTSRASYEIVQKAAAVGIAVVAAVSAPTGMAVRLAEAAGVTLIGFARGARHSVYSHPQRIH